MEVCHRFHTLIVSSSSASPQRGIDFLITRESKLDGTTAESHKGSSGVAGHSFIHSPPHAPPPTHTHTPTLSYPPNLTALPPSLFPSPSHRPSPPADVSGPPQSQVGVGVEGQGDESCSAGCVRRICRSDQQLHRGDIKVVEACGERHLALRLTEASVSCQHTHAHTHSHLHSSSHIPACGRREVLLPLNPHKVNVTGPTCFKN